MNSEKTEAQDSLRMFGTITLALRLVIGWTYFSAFWRRLVLENKLDSDAAGYIGEKFNHFLPNALGIKPVIEYLVSNPDELWWAMAVFTIIEAIVGLFIMLGLFTRLMSLGVIFLAMGILLGSGWLGTTCLDEWQIGVLGLAGGFTVLLSGGGRFSLDYLLAKHYRTGNTFRIKDSRLYKVSAIGALVILFITLFTNQYFHGGVWGNLHNKSVKPKVEISKAEMKNGQLSFTVFRVEGADVYGSFLIGITLEDYEGKNVLSLDGKTLSNFPQQNIVNDYVAKVKPGKYSLVLPLGARARLTLKNAALKNIASGKYILILTDISGIEWKHEIIVE
mgnify:CR=1 FL=1